MQEKQDELIAQYESGFLRKMYDKHLQKNTGLRSEEYFYDCIFKNSNFSSRFFEKYEFPFSWCLAEVLPWDTIQKYPERKWHPLGLSNNPSITWEIVERHEIDWDWGSLAANPGINVAEVKGRKSKYLLATWQLCFNPSVTLEFQLKNKGSLEWISCNPNVTWETVQKHPEIDWDYGMLSSQPWITWEIVSENLERPWNFSWLSKNISWKDIQQNPNYPWDFGALSENPTVTWDIILANPQLPWDYHDLSDRVPWDIFIRDPDRWNPMMLSMNPNISWKLVEENPQIDWSYDLLISNGALQGQSILPACDQ